MSELINKIINKITEKHIFNAFIKIIGANTNDYMIPNIKENPKITINSIRPTTMLIKEFLLRSLIFSIIMYVFNFYLFNEIENLLMKFNAINLISIFMFIIAMMELVWMISIQLKFCIKRLKAIMILK